MIKNLKKTILSLLFLSLFLTAFSVFGQDSLEERKLLEEELKQLEAEIVKYDQDITKTEKQKSTLSNQINLLRKEIGKLDLQIKQSNTMIKDLGLQITDTEKSINQTSLKIEDSRSRLSGILRTIYEEDQKSLVEILLSESELSGFFGNLAALETLNSKTKSLLKDVKELKSSLENQKQSLDDEKVDLENVVKIRNLQKKENEAKRKERDETLKMTEAQYQKYLTQKRETEKKAADIRSRIFELTGVPEAPTFGEALEIAKYVETTTGVRPAFLLAVLTQESSIGKNVGQCYVTDSKTGNGKVIFSGKAVKGVMKPTRDVQPFLEITKALGRDPYSTPVSCPIPSVGGYGGAMGPAQFIPSTWVLYSDRLKNTFGRPADPWNIKDAFMAAAFYLADAGAAKKTANAEWRAAMIYFSGSVNTKFRFYGDSVMKITKQYEQDIKELGN